MLLHLKKLSELSSSELNELRTSEIGGLVKEDNGDMIMGLLIEYIPVTEELDYVIQNASTSDRAKWINQIGRTLKVLHGEDIILGCVHSGIVLIDSKRNAWVTGSMKDMSKVRLISNWWVRKLETYRVCVGLKISLLDPVNCECFFRRLVNHCTNMVTSLICIDLHIDSMRDV